MKLRNIVTFQAPHFVPPDIQQIIEKHNAVIELEDAFIDLLISMASIVFEGLKQRGFRCEEPFFNLKWSAAQITVDVNGYAFAVLLKLDSKEHYWFIHVGSLEQYGAPLMKEKYNYEDANEHHAVCEAVDEVLRSDSQITDVRWYSYDERRAEREQQKTAHQAKDSS